MVLEFTGGSGDRYLFPKFSVVEFVECPQGQQQAIASFLIVRKGSNSEYGGDPDLDYYQPVTIRLIAYGHRFLEILDRVVAPPDSVQLYMEDIMSHMTRAEYVLLAMRLPREDKDASKEAEKEQQDTPMGGTAHMLTDGEPRKIPDAMPGVLWTAKPVATAPKFAAARRSREDDYEMDDQQYESFIEKITPKESRDV